jgi:hypothetical protein
VGESEGVRVIGEEEAAATHAPSVFISEKRRKWGGDVRDGIEPGQRVLR